MMGSNTFKLLQFRKLFPPTKWAAEFNAALTVPFFHWLVGPSEVKIPKTNGTLWSNYSVVLAVPKNPFSTAHSCGLHTLSTELHKNVWWRRMLEHHVTVLKTTK